MIDYLPIYYILCEVTPTKYAVTRERWSSRLWEETHNRKVVSSNPSTKYWMNILHITLF